MHRSIRWRLIASYTILTLLAVALVGVLALSLIREHLDHQERDYLTANGEAIARQVLPSLQGGFFDPSIHELLRTASFLGDVRVRLLDASMHVLADSGSPTGATEFFLIAPQMVWGNHPDNVHALDNGWIAFALERAASGNGSYRLRERFPLFDELPADTRFTIVQRSDDVWGARLSFGIDVGLNDDPIPEQTAQDAPGSRSDTMVLVAVGDEQDPLGYVELSAGSNFGDETLNTAAQAFLLAGLGAVLIAVLVGLWVGRGLTRPLLDLSAVAGRMSGGDLSVRAMALGRDEIGQLGGQFNQMAERLETSFAALGAERDALRRFIADASHELRTPITALRTFTDLLQGAAANDSVARAEFLSESKAQINRLEWITRNLLNLSRLDARLLALDMHDHDALELIHSAVAAFKPLAQEKDITLDVHVPSTEIILRCDRTQIEIALSNLLDNAIKFTPVGGRIEIGAEEDALHARVWVSDNGPGIAAQDQPHIFERFYQGALARHATYKRGSGLGLAIVRSVVQAHHGHVEVESAAGAGSRFVIILPRS